jgi:hypothetical protein
MTPSAKRTLAVVIGVAAFGPMTVAAVTFIVRLDAHARWLFPKRRWPPSPLAEIPVWVTALAIGVALLVIAERLMPKPWDYRRDALNSPIDDETHVLHVDRDRADARKTS